MTITLDGTTGITSPNDTTGNQSYTGTLTGGTGVVNLGSGQFYKDASGNVGIGTPSPSQKLVVNGNTLIPLTNSYYCYTTNYGMSTGTGLELFCDTGDVMRFITGGKAGTERMRIDSSGNVGIGTSSPAQKLSVLSSSATVSVAKFGATNYGNLGTTYIEIGTQFGDGNSRIGNINPTGNTSTLVFETMTASSGVFAERMRIDSSGNLLVGTTNNPTSSKLNVAGKVMVANNNVSNSAGNEYFFVDSGDRYIVFHGTSISSGAVHFYFQNPNGLVGSIETNGSSTSYVTSSDYRLKENIAPMAGALEKVAKLNPVTYNWKIDGSSGQGFIAHELQEVVPDCVTGEKDAVNEDGSIKPQGIDTSFLVATLTAAIQELKAIVDAQADRIAILETK